MLPILNAPMAAHGTSQVLGIRLEAADVGTDLTAFLALARREGDNPTHAPKITPQRAISQTFWHWRRIVKALFQPTAVLFLGVVALPTRQFLCVVHHFEK